MSLTGAGTTPYGGHAGAVYAVAFSPDGSLLATGGEDGVARLWDARTGAQRAELIGHTDHVNSVAFSPDGTLLATSGDDRTVRLWNTDTGRQRTQLTSDQWALSVEFSPHGDLLAAGFADGTVQIWNPQTGEQHTQLTSHRWVYSVAFSPGGHVLAAGGSDGVVELWDAHTWERTGSVGRTGPAVRSVAFSPDGALLATGGDNRVVRLWDRHTGVQRAELTDHTGDVNSVAFSPDGAFLATGGDDEAVRLWDPQTGRQHTQLTGQTGAAVWSVVFSPDDARLAIGCVDGSLLLRPLGQDVHTGERPYTRLPGHTGGAVRKVAFSPDGALLATGGNDRTVRLWNTDTGRQHTQLTGHRGWILSAAVSPDGTLVATGSNDRTVRLWNTDTGRQHTQLTGHRGWVWSVAFSPDGVLLATGGDDSTVRLWDPHTGRQHTQLTGQIDIVRAVAFSPDGVLLAAGGNGGVRLWDPHTGEQRSPFIGHRGWVWSVAFSPDGTLLATGGEDGVVRLWDARSGEQRIQLAGHTHDANSVAFSPDGTLLATGGGDAVVRLWDPHTGQLQAELTGHTRGVRSVAFSPDGRLLASVGDWTIRIWNPRNGKQIDGTGFGAPRRSGRPLAGVRSDSPSADDMLDVTADVETLADLIAATETRPPLAIALIGDWGAGKSSVMLQIQRRVDVLAEMSGNNPGLSDFAENVRQVRFNAWHYSDEHVWAGLVDHLFRTLASPSHPESTGDDGDPATARDLRRKLDRRRADQRRVRETLRAADRVRQPRGYLAWLGSPFYAWRILFGALRELGRDLRGGLGVVLGWAVLAAAGYLVWRFGRSWIGAISSGVVTALASAAAIGWQLRRAHRRLLRFVERRRKELDAAQRAADQDIARLEDQLVLTDAAARLSRFLTERGTPSAYEEYRGLLGKVHNDLRRLSEDLDRAHAEWRAGGARTPPPLQRIVLYIDDLDRCPPRRVVEVLEAVHLMLALELFVVVVAVDPRWLIRSLDFHHRRLFEADGEGAGVATEAVATPLDYLDKIFQIPYALTQPPPAAVASYLRSLLPHPEPAAPAAADRPISSPATPATPAKRTRPAPEPSTTYAANDDLPVPDQSEPADPEPAERTRLGPSRTGSAPSAAAERSAAVPDLRPKGLRLTRAEVEFLARLGGLVPTPRAAKKLVNLYRLLRIGVRDADLPAFTGTRDGGGPYQAAQILLALLVGRPAAAQQLFRRLLADSPDSPDIPDIPDSAPGDIVAFLAGEAKNEDLDPACRDLCGKAGELLEGIRHDEVPLLVAIEEYRRWCRRIARYSFHTRSMASTAPTASLATEAQAP